MKQALKYTLLDDQMEIAPYKEVIEEFLQTDKISVQSSGSTGPPKTFVFTKQQIEYSAKMTLEYFHLKSGDRALLSLSPKYVAAKMMILRAFLGDLELVISPPLLDPLESVSQNHDIAFAPFVPTQIKEMLKTHPAGLEEIKKVLIGGGTLDIETKKLLLNMQNTYFESFGMAETLTHFALKKIDDDYFHCLDDITIAQDANGTAVVHAPKLTGKESLQTNDMIECATPQKFKWLGRRDNLINTGGHKVHPELIEQKMIENGFLKIFYVHKTPDDKWGEKVVLVLEQDNEGFEGISPNLFRGIEKFSMPKEVYICDKFDRTASNKIRRGATFEKSKFLKEIKIEK